VAEDISNNFDDRPVIAAVTWADQDDRLKEMWVEQKSPEDIANALGRSVAAIMTRAARLGLPRRKSPGRKRGYKRSETVKRKPKVKKSPRVKVHVSTNDLTEADKIAQERIKFRVCLMCLNKFESLGAFNRICPSCKGSAEYTKGSSTPDFSFKVMG